MLWLDGVAITDGALIAETGITSLEGFGGLAATAQLTFENNAFTSLYGLGPVTTLADVSIKDVSDISELASLATVNGSFDIDVSLPTLSLPALAYVDGHMSVVTSATKVMLPLLDSVYLGAFSLNAPQLERLDLGLTDLGGDFNLSVGAAFPLCQAEAVIAALTYFGGVPNLDGGTSCLSIDRCRLQTPINEVAFPEMLLFYFGRVYIAGQTTLTNGVDTSVVLRASAGVGAIGTEPTDASWIWPAASATPGWDADAAGEPTFDEYTAVFPAPTLLGNYDTAFRFSGDGGKTWTYCDRPAGPGSDGSEDGYQVANAGTLAVQL